MESVQQATRVGGTLLPRRPGDSPHPVVFRDAAGREVGHAGQWRLVMPDTLYTPGPAPGAAATVDLVLGSLPGYSRLRVINGGSA